MFAHGPHPRTARAPASPREAPAAPLPAPLPPPPAEATAAPLQPPPAEAPDRWSEAEANPLRQALGAHLLALRRRQGRSLREAGALAGLSPQFISMVERGQTEIGLSRLIRLADAYDANIADLLAEINGRDVEFVPAANALTAPRIDGDPTVTYLTSPSWKLQPFRIEIAPGSRLEGLSHAGEEFIHCIEGGTITMTINGRDWKLSPGDTIVVPPRAQHSYRNDSRRVAVAIGAVAPPGRGASGRGEETERL